MNILDLIIIAILGIGLLAGMHRGMIASGLSLVGFVGAWFGAQSLYGKVVQMALSNQTMMAVLNQYLEPDSFFDTQIQAMTPVTDLVASGEVAISTIVDKIAGRFGFLKDAFSTNIRTLAFQKLGINTVSEYFDQTFWTAVFNVVAFVLVFILLYLLIMLVVNLLDRVICFPLLKNFDWLVGGLLGLVKASVVAMLVLVIVPQVTVGILPELTQNLINGSSLYRLISGVDIMGVSRWISKLIMG